MSRSRKVSEQSDIDRDEEEFTVISEESLKSVICRIGRIVICLNVNHILNCDLIL